LADRTPLGKRASEAEINHFQEQQSLRFPFRAGYHKFFKNFYYSKKDFVKCCRIVVLRSYYWKKVVFVSGSNRR
jgi:hypothetical protein